MAITNYYDILKIDPKSDISTIKRAFRKEIALYHPHNNKSPEASKQFDLIVEAFNILSNPEKREIFDKMLHKTTSNIPVFVEENKTYQDWKKESKTTSKKYKSITLEELLLLDVFIDVGLSGMFSALDGVGDSLDGLGDAIDGIFDLF